MRKTRSFGEEDGWIVLFKELRSYCTSDTTTVVRTVFHYYLT